MRCFRGAAAIPRPGPAGNGESFLWMRAGAPALREEDLTRAIKEGPAGDGRFDEGSAFDEGSVSDEGSVFDEKSVSDEKSGEAS